MKVRGALNRGYGSELANKNHYINMMGPKTTKNEPKIHNQQNYHWFLQIKKTESHFFHKKTLFDLMDLSEKYQL